MLFHAVAATFGVSFAEVPLVRGAIGDNLKERFEVSVASFWLESLLAKAVGR